MGSVHQLLGEVVAQGITALKGLVRAVGIAAGAVVVVHGGLGAGGSALQVGIIHQLLGEVMAQGITALKGLVRAVDIAAGAVVVVHGRLGASGSALQVGIIHQLLGEVVAQGGLQEAILGVVSLGGIHVAVLVGKILAAVGAVPVGIVAGLGAGGCLGFRLFGQKMVIGVLIRQLVAADLALGLGYAGGFIAGVGLVGRLLGAAVVLADLPVAGGVALIGLALVVVAQSGQQEGRVGGESGGRIQLAVLVGIVVAAVGAVPIGQVAAHLAGGSHSGRLGGASMGQRSDGKVRGIVIEVLVAVLEILVAVGAIAISLVTLTAAGGSGGSGGGNLGCGMVVGIELAVLALTDGTHSLVGAGGGGIGFVVGPLLVGAAGHGAAAPVLGVVMLPITPDMIGGVGDGEGPGGCREAIGGSEVTVAGDDQVHLVGAGIGGILYHLIALLIHQRSGLALGAQSVGSVQGDGGGLGFAVPNQVLGGSEGEVRSLGRSLGDGPGDGVAGDSAAPLVSILVQVHSGFVVARVGGFGDAADGVALAGNQEGALFTSIGIAQGGCGEADCLEILRHGHGGGIGGVGNIRCLDADIVGALLAYGGSALGAGGPGLAVVSLGPLHSGLGAADLAVHGLPGAGGHALKAAGSGGLRLGGGGGEGQGHFLRRGGAGDGDLGEAVTGDGDAVLGQIGRVALGEVVAVVSGDGHIRDGIVLQNRLLQVAGGGHVLARGDGDGAGLGDDVKLILVGIQLHLIALIAGEIVLVARVAGDVDGCDGAAVLQGLYLGGDTDGGALGEAGDSGEHCSSSHFREIEVVDHSLGVVAGNIHLAGQLKDPAVVVTALGNDTGIQTAAAPFFELGGRIAGDGGVADLHGAGGADAAAAFGGVIFNGGILDDRGDIGVTCGSAALGSGNIHAAAQAIPAVIAGNGGAVNGNGAFVCVDAAAAMRRGVVGDVGAAHGEGRLLHEDTAALSRGAAGDGAAVDVDGGVLAVHSAAVAGNATGTVIFSGFSGLAGDGAAVHSEDAILVIHGAAAAVEGLAAEGTGVHDEGAAIYIHHAAVAAFRVGTDGAAVHDELAAIHPHGAATQNIVAGAKVRIIAGELAVPQGEGGAGGHIHIPGVPAAAADRAGLALVAVRNGNIIAVIDINDRVVPGTAADAQAIEAEVDVLGGGPGFGIAPQQVVVARRQVFQLGNADPVELFVGVGAVGGVFPGAADAVGVALTVVPQLQAGIPRGQQGAGGAGGRPQDKAAVVHEEALGAGVARHHQSGNIQGAEADGAGVGIEAAVRGDGAAGSHESIAPNNGRHVLVIDIIGDLGLVVLHHDLAGENGGVGAVHSDAAAVPLRFVVLNGAVPDGGRALAVEVDAAAVAAGGVAGDGAVFNEGGARAAAVDGAAPAVFVVYIAVGIGIAREGAVLHREADVTGGVAGFRGPDEGTVHSVILKGAVRYRHFAGIAPQESALIVGVVAAADVDGGALGIDKGAAGFLLHGHIGQVEGAAGGSFDVVAAGGVVGIAGDVAGGRGAMLAVGDIQRAVILEEDRLALVAVEADIYGVVRAHGHGFGHLGILQQIIVAGGIAGDVGQRIDGDVGSAVGVGVSRYHGQYIVAVAVTDQGDLFRLEGEALVAVTNILAGVGDDRRTLCLLNARQGQGEGDAAAVRRTRRSYELLRVGEIEVVPGGLFGGVIPDDDGAGAQVHGTIGVHIDTAALIHSGVVLDGAAAQVQGAAYEHAAAADALRSVGILLLHGVGLDGGVVVHGEGAAAGHIDAAALGVAVGVTAVGQVTAYDGVAGHGELAGSAHIDATAQVFNSVIGLLGDVVRDHGIAGHGESAVVHGHAAAVAGGGVAGDLAAGHLEGAVAADIDGAAVAE